MQFIIGAIVLILILLVIGYITRKKYYKEIDKLEAWKIDIMNRPVLDELGKVKQLNMTGQTEEMFERWRKSWDDIVAVELPNVEDYLFDAEELTDRYRFKKAKETHQQIQTVLGNIEQQIESILSELNDLIGSEEKSRIEMEELTQQFRVLKKNLLIQRHIFGKSIHQLEIKLDALSSKFSQFEELTENGNYLEGREVVILLQGEIQNLIEKTEKIPDLITEVYTILPSQLNELEDGNKEMSEQGFILDHLQIDKELEMLRESLHTYTELLDKTEVHEVETGIQEMKEKIDILYELLEKEVHAKHYLIQNQETTKTKLEEIKGINEQIKVETDFVQQSYQLLEGELDIPYNLEKVLTKLIKRYRILEAKISDDQSSYTVLSSDLKEISDKIDEIKKEQQDFTEHLQNLRKDEMDAREKIVALRRKITEATRLLSKSHIPGLPNHYQMLFEQANEKIRDVYNSLNEKPLNMKTVQNYLNNANDTVEQLSSKTIELVESVILTEKVIQYGNRYRGRHPKVAEGLGRAEELFRGFDFEAALEEAATAVEELEPGSLKRIEEMINGESEKGE